MVSNEMNMGNSSDERSAFPAETPVGMAYVPLQRLTSIYEPDLGLTQGTIFPDLDYPWLGSKAFANTANTGTANASAGNAAQARPANVAMPANSNMAMPNANAPKEAAMPLMTMPMAGNAMPMHDNAMPMHDNAMPMAGNAMPMRDNAMPMAGNAMPMRDNAMPMADSAVKSAMSGKAAAMPSKDMAEMKSAMEKTADKNVSYAEWMHKFQGGNAK